MRVLVIGMGQVGRYLVNYLARDGHDIICVDAHSRALDAVTEEADVETVLGHGSAPSILERAGAANADLCVAVTDSDEVNLLGALAAKGLGTGRTLARVANSAYYTGRGGYARDVMGIDLIVNPQTLAAQEIHRALRTSGVLALRRFAGNRVEMAAMDVHHDTRNLDKTLREVNVPPGAIIMAIERNKQLIVPRGDTAIRYGDRLHMLGDINTLPKMEALFGLKPMRGLRKVIIAGCGEVGLELARALEGDRCEPIIIERNAERAEFVSSELSNSLVLCGDATDLNILKAEHIEDADAFIATTHEDEVNLMACLMAKDMGARRQVAIMHRSEAIAMCRRLGVEATVSPRRAAAEHILRQTHVGSIVSIALIVDGAAEILEVEVPRTCRALGRDLMYLRFPEGALVGTVVRGDRVFVPRGTDSLQPGDTVLVLATREARTAVEDIFRDRS